VRKYELKCIIIQHNVQTMLDLRFNRLMKVLTPGRGHTEENIKSLDLTTHTTKIDLFRVHIHNTC
jgi:hypothetical protein